MKNPICYFVINVYKTKQARAFYQKLFGWKIGAIDQKMSFAEIARTGTKGIGGGIAGTDSRGVTMYVEVKDLEGTLARARKLGGKVTRKIVAVPGWARICWFRDPAGNEIGLMSPTK